MVQPTPALRPDGGPEARFTGKHMLWLMLGFFGVIIAVNAAMAVLAASSWTGLIVKNSYVASQHYNETIDQARRLASLGWSAELRATGSGLELVMRTGKGGPVSAQIVTARLARATHERDDRTVRFVEQAPGTYRADGELSPGLWLADVEAKVGDDVFFQHQFRLTVQAGG